MTLRSCLALAAVALLAGGCGAHNSQLPNATAAQGARAASVARPTPTKATVDPDATRGMWMGRVGIHAIHINASGSFVDLDLDGGSFRGFVNFGSVSGTVRTRSGQSASVSLSAMGDSLSGSIGSRYGNLNAFGGMWSGRLGNASLQANVSSNFVSGSLGNDMLSLSGTAGDAASRTGLAAALLVALYLSDAAE